LISITPKLDSGNNNKKVPFRVFLIPLFLLAGTFFLNFMARIIPAPLMPTIERDLRIDHAEAGSLFLRFFSKRVGEYEI